MTPYAYLLLKARGPKIDKVPPLRLDLDFMDTSGYVVLPVESPTIPVDASPAKGSVRPFEKLQLTQTLDERQAAQGKLIVEIKAAARGLVPDLDQLVSLDQPGFEREKIDDQGVSVTKFNQESPATVIDSERTWLVTYHAAPGQTKPPGLFRFASAKVDDAEQIFQRLRRRRPGQSRRRSLARRAIRAGALCMALVARRRSACAGLRSRRGPDFEVQAQTSRCLAVPGAGSRHAFLGARPAS